MLDISHSPHFNLCWLRTLEWLLFLLENFRLRSFAVEPPCATFSPAAFPALRSYKEPRNYNPLEGRTLHGATLALRALTLLFVSLRLGVPGILEQPRRSKMAWLPEWKCLLELGATEAFTASCPFGSPRQKEFRFLQVCVDLAPICRPCARDHEHVRIQGKCTAPSAKYTPLQAIASVFDETLRGKGSTRNLLAVRADGLESLLANDVALNLDWTEGKSWHWRGCLGCSHILESSSLLRLCQHLAKKGPRRVVVLIDYSVALNSAAKDHSPSRTCPSPPQNRGYLRRCWTSCLLPLLPDLPESADCPTRDRPLPEPLGRSIASRLDSGSLYELATLPKLRRWAANGASSPAPPTPPALQPDCGWRSLRHSSRLFDSSLGFLGEGPRVSRLGVLLCLLLVACFPSCHGALVPRDAADRKRQAARTGATLPSGRPVERPTQDRRDKLLKAFERWLATRGGSLDDICGIGRQFVAEANKQLADYGRELFRAGWPYSHFSEVINAVSSREPSLRRCLQPAWDVAFAWLREEPHTHHVALPWQALLAVIATALIWGWPRTAGCIALTWGALLRIGETLAATRADLLLSGDVEDTCGYALLSIAEPKTRFKAARHQVARLDQPAGLTEVGCARL